MDNTLYISFILHQTATITTFFVIITSCISPLSYIKPQLIVVPLHLFLVVYLLYPTSNRNSEVYKNKTQGVVYLLYPTSNRNHTLSTNSL